jgi:hypothetical protein
MTQRNPTFASGWTKTELANRINEDERKVRILRDAISQYLTWYDNPTAQELATEALERLRLALKVTA